MHTTSEQSSEQRQHLLHEGGAAHRSGISSWVIPILRDAAAVEWLLTGDASTRRG